LKIFQRNELFFKWQVIGFPQIMCSTIKLNYGNAFHPPTYLHQIYCAIFHTVIPAFAGSLSKMVFLVHFVHNSDFFIVI